MKTFISDLSGKRFPTDEKVPAEGIRTSILQLIQQDYPAFDATKALGLSELNVYRERYISEYLSKQVGQLSDVEKKVLESLKNRTIVSDDPSQIADSKATVGQKVADKVASFGGSWKFIIIFISFLLGWIILNAFFLFNDGFDPYPFILLNLILSCLAALQAPVIMMSQNRQGDKDRERAKEDYMVNLKSELEVRALHEKLDHLMLYQQQELIEIQKIQIDMLTDLQKQVAHQNKTKTEKKAGE